MLIQQIDPVSLQSFQRSVGDFADVLGPAVDSDLLPFRTDFETKLRCDQHTIAYRRERLAYKFFVREWTIHFGRVEERNAAINRRPEQRNHLLLVRRGSVTVAHAH